MRHRKSTWVVVLAAAAWIGLAPATAQAEGLGKAFGLGIGSALCSLVYGPAKIVYAGLGSLIAGGAWALSGGDAAVAAPILNASVRGDYVITPGHLEGDEPLEFVGRMPDHHTLADVRMDEGF